MRGEVPGDGPADVILCGGKEKDTNDVVSFLAQKEGFEPSHGFTRLLP